MPTASSFDAILVSSANDGFTFVLLKISRTVSNELPLKSKVPVLATDGRNRYHSERADNHVLGSFDSVVADVDEVENVPVEVARFVAHAKASFVGLVAHPAPLANHSKEIEPVAEALNPPTWM